MFVDDLVRRHRLGADRRDYVDGMRRQDLASAMLHDLQFRATPAPEPAIPSRPGAWQQARDRAEALRDRLGTFRFGFIPARFSIEGLFGAMFLHGSFDHLLGNMLFLFVFSPWKSRWAAGSIWACICSSGVIAPAVMGTGPGMGHGRGRLRAISGLMGMYIGVYGLRKILLLLALAL